MMLLRKKEPVIIMPQPLIMNGVPPVPSSAEALLKEAYARQAAKKAARAKQKEDAA